MPGCFRAAAWAQPALTTVAPYTDFPATRGKGWLLGSWPGPVRAPPRGCGSPPVTHRAARGSAAIPPRPLRSPEVGLTACHGHGACLPGDGAGEFTWEKCSR